MARRELKTLNMSGDKRKIVDVESDADTDIDFDASSSYDVRTKRLQNRRKSRACIDLSPNFQNRKKPPRKKPRGDHRNEVEKIQGDTELCDDDYITYLKSRKHGSTNVEEEEDDSSADEDSDNASDCLDDPQYMAFLAGLEVDGNSHACRIPVKPGIAMVIQYEKKEVGSCDASRFFHMDYIESILGGKAKTSKIVSQKEGLKKRGDIGNVKETPKKNHVVKIKIKKTSKTEAHQKHTRKRGRPINFKRRRDVEQKQHNAAKKVSKEVLQEHKGMGENQHKKTLKSHGPKEPDFNENKDKITQKSCQPVSRNGGGMDETLSWVLGTHSHGNNINSRAAEHEIAKVKLENVDEYSDSETIIVGDTPFTDGCHTPFITSRYNEIIDLDEVSTKSLIKRNRSLFRENLMKALKKPFDRKEYANLKDEIYRNRTKHESRRLRGREIEYPTEQSTPAYIGLHNDLRVMLANLCPKKGLILLRGYFFWLENITQDGVFQPWKDSEFLTDYEI